MLACVSPAQRTDMTYILHWHTDLQCATTNWQQQLYSKVQHTYEVTLLVLYSSSYFRLNL